MSSIPVVNQIHEHKLISFLCPLNFFHYSKEHKKEQRNVAKRNKMIIQRKTESDWKASAWQIYDDHRERSTKKAYNEKGKNSYACYDIDELLFFLHFTIVFARSWEVMTNFRK